jgi:FAD/FMN-containing dehydrogenase
MKITRRQWLAGAASVAAGGLVGCRSASRSSATTRSAGVWVNDVHSQLNRTHVAGVDNPTDLGQLLDVLRGARKRELGVSLCGGRHAGGGQQFLTDRTLVDMSGLDRVLHFDGQAGTLEVEAGIRWPALINDLHASQQSSSEPWWAIHQKQGGADQLSLGGAVGSNVHGRCLASRPIVQDIVSLKIIDERGEMLTCNRRENADRFRHAIGGYGLFGVVYSVALQLERRQKLARHVKVCGIADAVPWLERQRDAGALHGDFQFSVDEKSDGFCNDGVCSWYTVAPADAIVAAPTPEISEAGFRQIVVAAHHDKQAALAVYRQQLMQQEGVVDWSDDWQRGAYTAGYHAAIDAGGKPGSEILSEIYVPRDALPGFMKKSAAILREHGANLIYGTVRLIVRDDETSLHWAKQSWACVIFNLHTSLDGAGIEQNAATFRALLDAAISLGGSYYLTYHRAARPEQTLACYPEFRDFFAAKRRFDPRGRWQSDWYTHYARLFA